MELCGKLTMLKLYELVLEQILWVGAVLHQFKAESVFNKKISGFSDVVEVKVFDGVPEDIQVKKTAQNI